MQTEIEMLYQLKAHRLVPWAWSVGWLLTGVGIWLSDIYSSPSRSLIPFIVLSALGWGIAGFVTASTGRGTPGMFLRLAAWGVAWLAFSLLGLLWERSWNGGFLGPIVATGLAGAIGGLAGSLRKGAWRLVSAVLLGVAFLLFALVSFYASYFFMLIYTSIAQQGGDIRVISALVWPLPGALLGLIAGFATRWILGLSKPRPPSLST
jgi:hypothetical protein